MYAILMSHCNDSFTKTITAYYNAPIGNTLTANTLPNNRVLGFTAYLYTINDIAGSYLIKNTIVQWGDGTQNVITSSALSVTAIHTYQVSNLQTMNANIIVCDINNICTTVSRSINIIYNIPSINKITNSQSYSTLSNSYTFNIIQGNYSVSSLQVNWNDGTPVTFISINTLTPTVAHTYALSGNYVIQATGIDSNGAAFKHILVKHNCYAIHISTNIISKPNIGFCSKFHIL